MEEVHNEISDELLGKRLTYIGVLMVVVALGIAFVANYLG